VTRRYAVREDDKRRVLVEIACDGDGCEATIKPHPEIATSGWMKKGTWEDGPSGSFVLTSDFCPRCAS